MTTSKVDNVLLVLTTIIRAIAGKDTSAPYEEATGKDRPIWFSRRVINTTVATVGTLLSVFMGVEVPQEAIEALTNTGEQAYEAVKSAWPAVLAFWSALMAVWGHIKRKKK